MDERPIIVKLEHLMEELLKDLVGYITVRGVEVEWVGSYYRGQPAWGGSSSEPPVNPPEPELLERVLLVVHSTAGHGGAAILNVPDAAALFGVTEDDLMTALYNSIEGEGRIQ